ncbi:unnamed protein product [Owenia fusiformis]|uniref:gluconokinase n=2 Tax=Owenia fusiformis TaxID=6347 RepID=A0A8S4NMV0_OWEFU|nr:unnamed protein product [Owenia fusiformis]
MSRGIPLTDGDREPWLIDIHNHIKQLVSQNQHCVVTCSALKQSYRNILLYGTHHGQQHNSAIDDQSALNTTFVYLKGSKEKLIKQIETRKNHFMPVTLLDSQLATLEEPTECRHVVMNIDRKIEDIVSSLVDYVHSIE